MKKLLMMPLMVAALFTGANADSFTVETDIPVRTSVAIGAASGMGTGQTAVATDTLTDSTNNQLVAGTAIDINEIFLASGLSSTTNHPITVSTNTKGIVLMTIAPSGMNHDDSSETMTTKYGFTKDTTTDAGGTSVAVSNAASVVFTLTNGQKTTLAQKVGTLDIEITPSAIQEAGHYTDTVSVVISSALVQPAG